MAEVVAIGEERGFVANPNSPSTQVLGEIGADSEKRPVRGHFSAYLQRMSRQERRRIQNEIIKRYKPGLTVENVCKALEGIDWRKVGEMLVIPASKLDVINEEYLTDEQRKAAVVRYWMLRDPFASWRRVILYLDRIREHELADRLRHYSEELTDSSLTHSNVTAVLNTVIDTYRLRACLSVPHSVRDLIKLHSVDSEERNTELIHYWLETSPYVLESWNWLSGRLLHWGEATALTAAKRYIHQTKDPTLTLSNITTIMKDVEKWKETTNEIDVPLITQNELFHDMQYRTTPQRKQAVWDYWLKNDPSPSWTRLANALYRLGEHGALEVLQMKYLKGSSESRRLFQLSMKRGFLDVVVDKMLFYGSAGVGKTCSMSVVTGEAPPTTRNSTSIATRPVTLYEMQATKEVWHKYTSKERMKLCAQISKSILGPELTQVLDKADPALEKVSSDGEESDLSKQEGVSEAIPSLAPARAEQPLLQGDVPTTKPLAPAPITQDPIDLNVIKVIHDVLNKMFELIEECPSSEEPLSYLHKVKIVDSGGQPQFHEVLPIFLRKMSLIVFVFKLSEELATRPIIEYFEEGEALGTPYQSDHTTEQLIEQGLQSLHSHRSGQGKSGDAPRIIILGTHKDEEGKSSESRQAKNEKLREMLLPAFDKEVLYYQPGTNEVIFPMNAKSPGQEEEIIAQAIRSVVKKECRSDPKRLPLQWLVLEIILEEITQKLQRGLLSKKECLEVARRLQLDESDLEAALMYLDELSMIFYYPEILPEIVFTNPQVLLDKVSELVKVHHNLAKSSKPGDEVWQKFFNHALVTTSFLSNDNFKKHYVPKLFRPEHLVVLFRKLFIFADYSAGKFFVPSLLRMLSSEQVAKHRLSVESLVAPLVVQFVNGPPLRGIFCALVCYLTSPENNFPGPWKLKMPVRSVTPTCLHRNCIQFTIPTLKTPCTVTLIDTLLQFEVHVKVISKQAALMKICSAVKHCISAGIRKASMTLGYTDCSSSFAFLCPCGSDEPHPATIGDGFWICHLDEGEGDEFSPNQLVWLEEVTPQEPQGDTIGLHVTPTMAELLSFEAAGGNYINIPREIGCKYHAFGSLLLLEDTGAHIEDLEHQYRGNGEEINTRILREWLDGRGRKPTTWATLVKVLNYIEKGELAHKLETCYV